ncbi:MAG: hypothetical protein ACI37O_07740 [Candidatus Avelusimicrobium sp.]|uniref:hypothetical protein n=1 Tax=Candidatus Avelusimicrobium sp. TaxID=3048833 RepID=UPI003EFFE20A
MTPEEALRALEETLKKYLNCEIRRENEKHADSIVLDDISADHYFYSLFDLPNVDKFINLEIAESSSSEETLEMEVDLSFSIRGKEDYFRALRYRQALRRVLVGRAREKGLDLHIEGCSVKGLNRGSLKRYLVSYRVSTTTI